MAGHQKSLIKKKVSWLLRGVRTGDFFCPGSPLSCVCVSCFSLFHTLIPLISIRSQKFSEYHRNILDPDLKISGSGDKLAYSKSNIHQQTKVLLI
ncbi:unnamed protein product [Arabidopsis lyrata]|nr:unnamed protein product [Arabidopsis lyrata]